LSFNALLDLKERVKRKYHRFIRGEYTIRDVLQKPFELAQVALGIVAESLNVTLPNGVTVHVQSDIPMGCGMGSSAATIVSVMHAVAKHLNLPISEEALYKLALEAEQMQHGQSSGLDLRVALNGGCFYMHDQHIEARQVPNVPMYLVNSGTPISSTGQCVERVASHFKSGDLVKQFTDVTQAMDAALQVQSLVKMQAAVRDNHCLLTQIGVVPNRVQQFVMDIENAGGAAKVCGAGSVIGDQAGALWVLSEDKAAVERIAQAYAYNIIPLEGAARGVYAA
jgi:mevalonate kinase